MTRRTLFLSLVAAGSLVVLGAACSSYNQEPSSPSTTTADSGAVKQAATAPSGCPSTPAAIPSAIAGVPPIPANVQTVTTASGLRYADLNPGNGDVAKAGQTATVQYTGWLPDGTKFDSSADHGPSFSFPLGGGQVIKGWDEGVAGMKVGGERLLIVPPDLGYGPRGGGGVIPPCATLIFDVHLLGVK
jgi:ABC-type Fe3+-hydroxamate transport system substrate-binding protein